MGIHIVNEIKNIIKMSSSAVYSTCHNYPECEWLYNKVRSHHMKIKQKKDSDLIKQTISTSEPYQYNLDIISLYKNKRKLLVSNDAIPPSSLPVSTR